MKWFLSDDVPGLVDALRASGEEVVSEPAQWARSFIDGPGFHPVHYPLDRLALQAVGRDGVAVLVNPLRVVPFPDGRAHFAYNRAAARTLRNARITLVMYADDDGATLQRFVDSDVHWKCACRQNDVAVHLVTSDAAGDIIRGSHRVALWRPGEDAARLVAAVAHAKRGRTY